MFFCEFYKNFFYWILSGDCFWMYACTQFLLQHRQFLFICQPFQLLLQQIVLFICQPFQFAVNHRKTSSNASFNIYIITIIKISARSIKNLKCPQGISTITLKWIWIFYWQLVGTISFSVFKGVFKTKQNTYSGACFRK